VHSVGHGDEHESPRITNGQLTATLVFCAVKRIGKQRHKNLTRTDRIDGRLVRLGYIPKQMRPIASVRSRQLNTAGARRRPLPTLARRSVMATDAQKPAITCIRQGNCRSRNGDGLQLKNQLG
jgi:hypothetical protein